ncbi:MAG TPA: hypothetical protein VF399_09460 [bacterium]
MKNIKKITNSLKMILIAGALIYAPCCYEEADNEPPAIPRGLTSVTGDEEVMLYWYANNEPDLEAYRIYRSYDPEGPYYLIGETNFDYFLDYGLENGLTYFYAITAFDENGNESDLSYELVFDTPRPEGYNIRLYDVDEYPVYAGWDFSEYEIVSWNYSQSDIYYDYDSPSDIPYLLVYKSGGLIQDMGYTESMDDITYAPDQGWSPSGVVEAVEGHTYVFWTWDNHFAKLRVTEVGPEHMVFDWAYQIDPGNPELVIGH